MPVSPGTAVTCTVANTAYPIYSGHKLVKTLIIQPKYTNQGIGFVGDSTLSPTTDIGVMKQLEQPSNTFIPNFTLTEHDAPNGLDLGNFQVSSTNAGDIFYFSYNEQ
jgi:hypothetical protein